MVEGVVAITLVVVVAVLIVIVVVLLLVVVVFIKISWGLDGERDTFRQVWKWVDQLSLLEMAMVERAAVTELARPRLEEDRAYVFGIGIGRIRALGLAFGFSSCSTCPCLGFRLGRDSRHHLLRRPPQELGSLP